MLSEKRKFNAQLLILTNFYQIEPIYFSIINNKIQYPLK